MDLCLDLRFRYLDLDLLFEYLDLCLDLRVECLDLDLGLGHKCLLTTLATGNAWLPSVRQQLTLDTL